ncbi:para-nitrobenzyl esterase [Periconia macrospinosa]|uniref:Para-nitrobenzyl esterase n=1 Tax=Periconia macrospinosa TaxID=97972 RepID=A0A2V1DWQ9_9PLEO|nr:para-nitrobenzyl esterase [Periconia macrospinosa]
MTKHTLKHSTLNRALRGSPSASTVQFRNLKFASISGRWQDSVPNENLPGDPQAIFDATKFGPSCPQKHGAQAWDVTLTGNVKMPLQEGHQASEELMDEFDCLSVNVTVPSPCVGEGKQTGNNRKGLPVFVWVHGGGLSMGSNSWPQYDLTKFVERSVEVGEPVIGVSLNYRVGILGFLASEELGINGNFGYKDQILAFRWVKKHIAGFGGDPNNITAAGESAGGISLSTLLCADVGSQGLFERVVVMSGDATLRAPRSKEWHEYMYHDQLKFLGLDKKKTNERKTALAQMDAGVLVNKLPLAQHFCACIDGEFLKNDVRLRFMGDGNHKQHKPDWCTEFVIGDTAHDGTILKARVLDNPDALSLLRSVCAKHLSPFETSNLLAAYNIPAPIPAQTYQNLLELASELRFYLPTLTAYSGWKTARPPKYSRRYHFHVHNPIEGSSTGLASHEFDVALLLNSYESALDETRKETAKQMRDQWIRFANGKGWCEAGTVVVIGDGGVVMVDEKEYDDRYRGGRGKVLESIGAERLWAVAEAWQGVRKLENAKAKI